MSGAWCLPAASAAYLADPPAGQVVPPSTVNILPTVISHVVFVMEENHDLSWTLSDPTFESLYDRYSHATHAYAVCHPSAPNYLAATDATKRQCGSDGVSYYSSTNLAWDLSSQGRSWQGLFESMPSACDRANAYPYEAHHNPWIYYTDLKAPCKKHDLSFTTTSGASRLQQEVNARTLPSFTFVSPNMLHDAHDGSLSAASSWLNSKVIDPIQDSLYYSTTTAIFVTFDEAYQKSCGCSQTSGYTADGVKLTGGPIYLVVVSPISPGVHVVTFDLTFFNVVSTIEWLLGIPSLGHYDSTHFPAITGLFV